MDLSLGIIFRVIKDQVTGAVKGIGAALRRTGQEAVDAGGGIDAGLRRGLGGAKAMRDGIESISTQLNSVEQFATKFAFIDQAINRLGDLAGVADEAKGLAGRLQLVAGAGDALTRALADVRTVANAAGADINATGDLYATLARTTKESAEGVNGLTKTIAQANSISNQGAAAADGAVRQLSQALASGVLRGDEFNSVMEQAPRLVQAMADGLGVTIGQLRQMAGDGKLTTEAIIGALRSQAAVIDQEFTVLPDTIARATQRMANEWQVFIGELDRTTGASDTVAAALGGVANNLHAIGAAALLAGEAVLAGFIGKATIGVVQYGRDLMAARAASISAAEAAIQVSQSAQAVAVAHLAAGDAAALAAQAEHTLAVAAVEVSAASTAAAAADQAAARQAQQTAVAKASSAAAAADLARADLVAAKASAASAVSTAADAALVVRARSKAAASALAQLEADRAVAERAAIFGPQRAALERDLATARRVAAEAASAAAEAESGLAHARAVSAQAVVAAENRLATAQRLSIQASTELRAASAARASAAGVEAAAVTTLAAAETGAARAALAARMAGYRAQRDAALDVAAAVMESNAAAQAAAHKSAGIVASAWGGVKDAAHGVAQAVRAIPAQWAITLGILGYDVAKASIEWVSEHLAEMALKADGTRDRLVGMREEMAQQQGAAAAAAQGYSEYAKMAVQVAANVNHMAQAERDRYRAGLEGAQKYWQAMYREAALAADLGQKSEESKEEAGKHLAAIAQGLRDVEAADKLTREASANLLDPRAAVLVQAFTAQVEELRAKGVPAAEATAQAMGSMAKSLSPESVADVRAYGQALAEMADQGQIGAHQMAAAWVQAIGKMAGADLAQFRATLGAAFGDGERDVVAMASAMDAILRRAILATGQDWSRLTTGISAGAQDALASIDLITDGQDRLREMGVDVSAAIRGALKKAFESAVTQRDLDTVTGKMRDLGLSAKQAGAEAAKAFADAATKVRDLSAAEDLLAKARGLRAKGKTKPAADDPRAQISAEFDLTNAQQAMLRLSSSGGDLAAIQAQAQAVRELASAIADQTKAAAAQKFADDQEAAALERTAEMRRQAAANPVLVTADVSQLDSALIGIEKRIAGLRQGVTVPIRYAGNAYGDAAAGPDFAATVRRATMQVTG